MISFFHRKKEKTQETGAPTYLIVGLGNPGPKYEITRHNIGFIAIDALAQANHVRIEKLKFKSLIADTTIAGQRVILMKPQTFMNNSGDAIEAAAHFYKVPVENIIILFDDVSLKPGQIRIRRKGSDGGHNGIKSIIQYLNSDQFPRVKIGVGEKPHPNYELADWVLSKFKKEEEPQMKEAVQQAVEAVELIIQGKTTEAMNLFN